MIALIIIRYTHYLKRIKKIIKDECHNHYWNEIRILSMRSHPKDFSEGQIGLISIYNAMLISRSKNDKSKTLNAKTLMDI